MKITINSMSEFNEIDFDRAYGVAKVLLHSSHDSRVKRIGEKTFTALKSKDVVMGTIHQPKPLL